MRISINDDLLGELLSLGYKDLLNKCKDLDTKWRNHFSGIKVYKKKKEDVAIWEDIEQLSQTVYTIIVNDFDKEVPAFRDINYPEFNLRESLKGLKYYSNLYNKIKKNLEKRL